MARDGVRRRPNLKQKDSYELSRENEDDDKKWPYSNGNLDPLAKAVGAAVVVVMTILITYFRYQQYLRDIIITPMDSPLIIPANSSTPAVNPDRFWGTYRPQAYFGIKSRSKTSPVFGLMWMTQLTNQMPPPLRHWCDQGDQLEGYVWQKHDGLNFGVQEIREKLYTIKTEFVKQPGGSHSGDWSARISFTPKNPSVPVVVSSFFYSALDVDNGRLEPKLTKGRLTSVHGWHEDLGDFELQMPNVAISAEAGKTGEKPQVQHSYFISYAQQLDQLKDIMVNGLKVEAWDKARTKPYFSLSGRRVPRDVPGPNFVVKQVTTQLPFTMEVLFQSGSFVNRGDQLSKEKFSALIQSKEEEFDAKFENIFHLKQKGYQPNEISFAKAALSNMLGGIGYFYGSSLVQSRYNKEPINYWEAPLYTAVPSRPFFPRGFLWDEGFHNMLISMWSPEISKDIIGHWMDLMNADGWIPREQILGSEARAKVPSEFVVQRNTNANPPTFFLPLQALIKEMIKSHKPQDKAYLKALYPRLKTWFNYYNTTQKGDLPFTYRWHGRDPTVTKQLNPLTLTSGLDDYPRASHPTTDERHVDLRCWIALAAGVMADIARSLGQDWQEYKNTYALLTDNKLLDELHWSSQGQQYSDWGLHTDKARLEKPKPPPNHHPSQRPPPMDTDKIRVILSEPSKQFVNAFGYVSLFPFLLKIVDADSPKLDTILSDLTNPTKLWTDFGLRSISRNSKFYGRFNSEHDPPYWRGAIWINMNYLCLSALYHYSSVEGPYMDKAKTVYTDLRKNLVTNIFKEYERTGYIWENYNDKTGEGKGSHPFTGWSALVVLIMAETF
ncbi:mannosyl-oligosaccharide glucosidase [Plakobranchus ocellatus]|uniref:Mannosyl-oligosaccharide glucosidase n=1 Tax=Plakobranchus ocellatus TaxID=259542 RepID=A0AAV4BKW7_9GAST|nr:mannosyl-oligosaccharide glucosidase [Plakobranchus ocellatus]